MLYHLLISALLTSTTVARALSPFVANEDQQTNQDITFLNNVPIQGSTDSDLTIDANNNDGLISETPSYRVIRTQLANGDEFFQNREGTVIITSPDGKVTIKFADGTVATQDHLGTDEIFSARRADGSVVIQRPDGTLITTSADRKIITTTHRDGTTTVGTKDGSRRIIKLRSGAIATLDPDGTLTVDVGDGRIIVKDPNGKITSTDKDGNVVEVDQSKEADDSKEIDNTVSEIVAIAGGVTLYSFNKMSQLFNFVAEKFGKTRDLWCAINGC